MTEYIVVFDDGRFLGGKGKPVTEYPDAEVYTNKRKAEQDASKVNLPSTVTPRAEYAAS